MAKTTIVQLMTLLKEKKLTVALAESMTCGLMAHQFCSVKGTSEVLRGSIVCYHPDIKVEVCHIPRSVIEKFTPESQEVTDKLAVSISKLFKADIYMAVTGLASSGGSEGPDKPVGTTFLSVYYEDKLHRLKSHLNGTPLQIRKKTCEIAYQFLLVILQGNSHFKH